MTQEAHYLTISFVVAGPKGTEFMTALTMPPIESEQKAVELARGLAVSFQRDFQAAMKEAQDPHRIRVVKP